MRLDTNTDWPTDRAGEGQQQFISTQFFSQFLNVTILSNISGDVSTWETRAQMEV
jgi:hypothetical protein